MVQTLSETIHLWSTDPFAFSVVQYRLKGWNVLPLPEKKKKSPPGKSSDTKGLGFTGRDGRLVEDEDVEQWLKDEFWKRGNIAVRPGNVIQYNNMDYEVIGIDVDDYEGKSGGKHLLELEKTHGPLPNTYTSSARADGVSGIRWFLTPSGFEYLGKPVLKSTGKASDSIEIIQKKHRYGILFPSVHPEGLQYRWYGRGQAPDGIHFTDEIPNVVKLAELPDSWWKFLTRNGIEESSDVSIDMDISDTDLYSWATKNLAEPLDLCEHMSKAMIEHLDDIDNASDHHEPLVRAHWHLYRLGAEGHTGWKSAINVVGQAWGEHALADGSRTVSEVKFESARSKLGSLRKLKGKYNEFRDRGYAFIESEDPCAASKSFVPPPRKKAPKRPTDYERNEDGNAEHFLNLYPNKFRFVVNHTDGAGRWLVFSDKTKRWLVDTKDDLTRHLFRQVKVLQQKDARRLLTQALTAQSNAGNPTPASIKEQVAQARAWKSFALESGNKARVGNSLAQAQSFKGVSILFEELDKDLFVVPVANGIIKFNTKEQVLEGAQPFEFIEDLDVVKEMMVTQNTNVPYIPFKEQRDHEDPAVRDGYRKFTSYMDKFLKSQLNQESWEYLLKLMGISILGVDTKKAVFLVGKPHTGKSTFQNMMNAALGDLSLWREPKVFEDSTFKSALAEALPRRVMMVGELGEKHIDASLFKRITGGDEVSCQLKNVNKPVTMKARCTIISGCNDAPEVPDADEATKARFVVIPFKHQVSKKECDPNAIQELPKACKVAMLAMLIEHASKGLLEGVNAIPDELQFATKDFVSNLSELSDFLRDVTVQVPESECAKYARNDQLDLSNPLPRWPDDLCIGDRELFDKYKVWCDRNGVDFSARLSKPKMTRKLKQQGWIQDGSWSKSNQRRWIGVYFAKQAKMVKDGSSG